MATARAILQAHVDDLFSESVPLDWQWSLANGVLDTRLVNLAQGDNTITIATNTVLLIIDPPTTNTAALKMKLSGGETGVTLLPTRTNPHGYGGGTVIVNASQPVTGVRITCLG